MKGPAKKCGHEWYWHCPPIGPDWCQCTKCGAIEVECYSCKQTMPRNRYICECGKRRAPNARTFVVVS